MITYYLRFPSQEDWKQAAAAVGVLNLVNVGTEEEPDMQEQWSYYTHEWACDDVGTIYNDDGIYNPETGEEITPPTPMEGWHANYVGELPEDWSQYLVSPQQPYRVFA